MLDSAPFCPGDAPATLQMLRTGRCSGASRTRGSRARRRRPAPGAPGNRRRRPRQAPGRGQQRRQTTAALQPGAPHMQATTFALPYMQQHPDSLALGTLYTAIASPMTCRPSLLLCICSNLQKF